MSIFEDTNPRALKELLGEIHSLSMVLPDFQRDFVWDPAATQELIVSIASDFPAGSILRVRDPHSAFAPREFEGAPPLGSHKHTFLVLDGQQRLTSLYQAFYGVGEHRYFLDLKKLREGKDFEEAIFHLRATTRWAKALESPEAQARDLLLPLSELRVGAGGFLQWLLRVTNPLPAAERTSMLDALTKINDAWIKTIESYHFPVVTLADTTEPEALCTIFETLNRTGVKLTVFELLTARFWPQDVKLRDLWAGAQASHPILAEFEVDPYYLLQAVALVARDTPSCKKGDVLKLTAAQIKEWWPQVVEALASGLQILRDDCGVVVPKWLPYPTMQNPLAAVLAKVGLPGSPEAGARRQKIARWFWCASLSQAYESATNSQAVKDFTQLCAWLAGGPEPETVAGLRFDPKALRDVTPRQRAIYRAVMCMVLRQRSLDFHSTSVITAKLIADEGIDDHHIFPDHFLLKAGFTNARLRESVLNRTLIDRKTNQTISDRAPSDYMHEIRETAGFPFEKVLTSHFLPVGPDSPFWSDDYEQFLGWRQDQLWKQVQLLTGVQGPSDLESEDAVA